MAKEHPRLKLGKRASFVKTHLKQSPQEGDTWEADFRAMPKPRDQTEEHYLGVVVALPKGDPLGYMPMEYTPTVNDLADLLAEAMRRPLTGSARRPQRIRFRGNPRWEELFPHLKELGIEISLQEELPQLEEIYVDFLREMRRHGPRPVILLSPRPTPVTKQFPATSAWVGEFGWIEVGKQQDTGVVVRALDDGGLVFEDDKPTTLAEAMAALEKGLVEWFNEKGIEVS